MVNWDQRCTVDLGYTPFEQDDIVIEDVQELGLSGSLHKWGKVEVRRGAQCVNPTSLLCDNDVAKDVGRLLGCRLWQPRGKLAEAKVGSWWWPPSSRALVYHPGDMLFNFDWLPSGIACGFIKSHWYYIIFTSSWNKVEISKPIVKPKVYQFILFIWLPS